jgi:hypothetical protein
MKSEARNRKQIQITKIQNSNDEFMIHEFLNKVIFENGCFFEHLIFEFRICFVFRYSIFGFNALPSS